MPLRAILVMEFTPAVWRATAGFAVPGTEQPEPTGAERMSKTTSQRKPGPSSPAVAEVNEHEPTTEPAALDALADDDLQKELEKLAAENEQLLAGMGLKAPAGDDAAEPPSEVEQLRAENRELRARVAELEQQVEAGGAGTGWEEQ